MTARDERATHSAPEPLTAAGDGERHQQIRAEQISLVYQQGLGLVIGSSAGAVVTALILWDIVPRPNMIFWLGLVFFANVFLAVGWAKYRSKNIPPAQAHAWGRLFTLISLIAGCSWGTAGFLLFAPESLAHQIFLALMLFAAAQASSAATVAYPPAFYVSFIPMLVPLMLRFAIVGDMFHYVLAATALIYGFTLGYFAQNIHRTLLTSLRLQFENLDLVTALTVQTEEAAARTAEAERANIAKSRFLAAASHDLRQPLHALGLLVGALEEKVQESERDMVEKIQSSVHVLDDLFNSLLDISKLDAGVLTPEPQDFAVAGLLERMTADYGALAEEKRLRFRVMPCRAIIRSDPVLLDRIVRNLVANAVKYTESGGVVLGCRRHGSNLRIEVWDTGPGIPDHQRQDVFQEFYQIGNPERDRSRGLGLGLAIVDRIARLLDHPISVTSIPGRGSVFSVEVPVATSTVGALQPAPLPQLTSPNLSGFFVVVVDDDLAILEGMRKLCESWGCRVLADSSETGLLEQFASQDARPDAIIADYRLSGGSNGVQVIDRIKARFGKDIPGILISGDTAVESLRHAEASGYPLLNKPLQPAALRSLLSFLLREKLLETSLKN